MQSPSAVIEIRPCFWQGWTWKVSFSLNILQFYLHRTKFHRRLWQQSLNFQCLTSLRVRKFFVEVLKDGIIHGTLPSVCTGQSFFRMWGWGLCGAPRINVLCIYELIKCQFSARQLECFKAKRKASERATQVAAHALLQSCRACLKSAMGDLAPRGFGRSVDAPWLVQKTHIHLGAWRGPILSKRQCVAERLRMLSMAFAFRNGSMFYQCLALFTCIVLSSL